MSLRLLHTLEPLKVNFEADQKLYGQRFHTAHAYIFLFLL